MTHQPLCESSVSLFFHHKTSKHNLLSAVPGRWLRPGWTRRRTAGCSAGCRCLRGWPASVFLWVCGQFPDAGCCSELACCNLRSKKTKRFGHREQVYCFTDNFVDNVTPDLRCFQVFTNNSVNMIFTSGTRTSVIQHCESMLNMSLCLSEKPEKPDSMRGSKYAI